MLEKAMRKALVASNRRASGKAATYRPTCRAATKNRGEGAHGGAQQHNGRHAGAKRQAIPRVLRK